MNRNLAKAVIDTFQQDVGVVDHARLSPFTYRDWTESYAWLDASGLALYFLEQIKASNIECVIPVKVVERLEKNLLDNRLRTADMFAEFMKINREFERAGLSYVNFKGFALAPYAYVDPFLRCQMDLDFLMAQSDAQRCQSVLEGLGYTLTGTDRNVREYKAGAGMMPSLRDLYKPRPQRCIEVHVLDSKVKTGPSGCYDILSRSQRPTWNEFEFPVLCELDTFIAQAHHLSKHIQSEWTRISWILEYANHVHTHRANEAFWLEVLRKISIDREAKVAVGIATLVASQAFRLEPPEPAAWAVRELPESVRLWIAHYGSRVLLAEFPGTKLYLLLQKNLREEAVGRICPKRRSLIPIHLPPIVTKEHGLVRQFVGLFVQIRFIWFRLCFHVTQNLCYMIEVPRWKRIMADGQSK